MGRLIEANTLKGCKIIQPYVGEISFQAFVRIFEVDEIPTAYDLDNVIKKLKKLSYERYGNDGMGGERVVNLDDVIEIVRGGGVDG